MKRKPPKSYYIKLFFGALEATFNTKRFVPYWLPIWAWMFFIYYLSSFHQFSTGLPATIDVFVKKSWHVFAFFILAALVYRAFRSYKFLRGDSYLIGACWSFAYAIFDEIHQLFVRGRHGRIVDVLIDLGGILIFGLLLKLFTGEKKKQ